MLPKTWLLKLATTRRVNEDTWRRFAPTKYNKDRQNKAPEESNQMYPEIMVIPMREELTRVGIKEARTADDVDAALAQPGTTMVVVNSICGCAAGKMRPGVRLALQNSVTPDRSITVFAGQDREATERARSYFAGQPPTSPAVAILRDGKLVYLMQRFVIESNPAQAIGQELARAFSELCVKTPA
jgi:putative YphP/YqiW family bacilliredoxin